MNIRSRKIQLELTMGDSRQIEKVINQTSFQFDIAPDHLNILGEMTRQVGTVFQQRRRKQDGAQRRPQFVAEHGEELVLGAIRLLRVGPRASLALENLFPLMVRAHSFGNDGR